MEYLKDHRGYARAELQKTVGDTEVVAVYRYADDSFGSGVVTLIEVKKINDLLGIDVTSRFMNYLTSSHLVRLAEATVRAIDEASVSAPQPRMPVEDSDR